MKIQLHVGTKTDLSFNFRHFWPMKSFRWPRFQRKTDYFLKISDAIPSQVGRSYCQLSHYFSENQRQNKLSAPLSAFSIRQITKIKYCLLQSCEAIPFLFPHKTLVTFVYCACLQPLQLSIVFQFVYVFLCKRQSIYIQMII